MAPSGSSFPYGDMLMPQDYYVNFWHFRPAKVAMCSSTQPRLLPYHHQLSIFTWWWFIAIKRVIKTNTPYIQRKGMSSLTAFRKTVL